MNRSQESRGPSRAGSAFRLSVALAAAVAAVAAVAALAGCRSLRDRGDDGEAAAAETPSMKVPVGTVHLAQAGSGFVLVRTTRFLSLEPGTKLTSVNAQGVETAWLEASEARQGSFLTADILGGVPSPGEQVIMDYRAERRGGADAGDPFGGGEGRQILE